MKLASYTKREKKISFIKPSFYETFFSLKDCYRDKADVLLSFLTI